MESFAVDLDKVLDDFEESEHVNGSTIDANSGSNVLEIESKYNLPTQQQKIENFYSYNVQDEPSIYDQGSGFFDLSEANFGPSVTHSEHNVPLSNYIDNCDGGVLQQNNSGKKNIDTQEGYFVPEELKSESYSNVENNVGKEGSVEFDFNDSAAQVNNQPELLQAASALQAHLADTDDRPSFMSSSPPSGVGPFNCGTPDIIPTSNFVGRDKNQLSENENTNISPNTQTSEKLYSGLDHQVNCANFNNPNLEMNSPSSEKEKVSFYPVVQRDNEVVISSSESSSWSGTGCFDQQYSILSSVPDIAKDEPTIYSSNNSSPEIIVEHNVAEIEKHESLETFQNICTAEAEKENFDYCNISDAQDKSKSADSLVEPISSISSSNVIPDVTLSCMSSICAQTVADTDGQSRENRQLISDTIENETDQVKLQCASNDPTSNVSDRRSVIHNDVHQSNQQLEFDSNTFIRSENDTFVSVSQVKEIENDNEDNQTKNVSDICIEKNDSITIETDDKSISEINEKNSKCVVPISNGHEICLNTTNGNNDDDKNKVISDNINISESLTMNEVNLERKLIKNTENMQISEKEIRPEISHNANIEGDNSVIDTLLPFDSLTGSIDINAINNEVQNDLDMLEQEINNETNEQEKNTTTDINYPKMELSDTKTQNGLNLNESIEIVDKLVAPVDDLNKRRGSGESVERFLAPSVMSPGIATPMEDAGFTKIPGFLPELVSMPEDDQELKGSEEIVNIEPDENNDQKFVNSIDVVVIDDKVQDASTTASGARPKDVPGSGSLERSRKNRPNSLLGLSTPDLPGAKVIQNEGSMSPNGTTEINPFYVASMQRPGLAPNRVIGESSRNNGRPTSLLSLNINRPSEDNTMSNHRQPADGNRSLDSSLPPAQQHQSSEGYTPVSSMQKTPETPPPAYTAHPQMPVPFALQQQFQGEQTQAQPVPPTSINLPASHGVVVAPVQGYDATRNTIDGGNFIHNQHAPLHRVSAGQAYPQGISLQQSLRPNSLNVVQSPVPQNQQFGGMTPSPTTPNNSSVMTPGIDPGTPVRSSVENAAEVVESNEQRHGFLDSLEAPPGLTPSPGHTPGMMLPPPSSSNPAVTITDLGKLPPTWLPDAEAPLCMQCEVRFTFTKRRHHCRACGKVFCSTCCNLKSKLKYLESKEARVCSKCYQDLIRAQVFERMGAASNTSHPNSDSTDPLLYSRDGAGVENFEHQQMVEGEVVMQQQQHAYHQGPNPNNPSSMKRENSKQVMFSDGVRPGSELTRLDGSEQTAITQRSSRKNRKGSAAANGASKVAKVKPGQTDITHFLPEAGLPPIFICSGENGELIKEENPCVESTMTQLKGDEASSPISFVVNKNLVVLVKMVNLDCCLNKKCICFASKGLCTVGQCEVVIVLECLPDENTIPLDIFRHYQYLYEQASKGNTVSNMDHSIFAHQRNQYTNHGSNDEGGGQNNQNNSSGFLGSQEHGGFLYISPSFQCLLKLVQPEKPYLVAVLLQKWEMPWAKVFPLRLQLRLGAEFRYYPCPLVSVRHRKPVYGEIGHTIMNLLVDFRNYQYSLPQVRGFTVHMKDRKTYLNFPRNRYQDVVRVLSSGNEHVIAVGATFSDAADSYLVCIQNDEGNYQTQAINIQNKPRKVTGATFVVFNGALKSSSNGVMGKSSIVEDGLMIQVLPEVMSSIRQSLRDMKNFSISCGMVNGSAGGTSNNSNGTNSTTLASSDNKPDEEVIIQWVEDDKNFNKEVRSAVDDFPLEGVECVHVHNTGDYSGPNNKAIRWVEVFFLQTNEESSHLEPVDLSRLAETLSTATCVALAPKLDKLSEAGLLKIGLRATIDNEMVGYEVGSNGQKLPDLYMDSLDNELIPVIHNAASQNRGSSVTLELVFYVINT